MGGGVGAQYEQLLGRRVRHQPALIGRGLVKQPHVLGLDLTALQRPHQLAHHGLLGQVGRAKRVGIGQRRAARTGHLANDHIDA